MFELVFVICKNLSLNSYAKISVIEVDDEKIMNNSSLKEDEKVKENEGIRFHNFIKCI